MLPGGCIQGGDALKKNDSAHRCRGMEPVNRYSPKFEVVGLFLSPENLSREIIIRNTHIVLYFTQTTVKPFLKPAAILEAKR